MSTVTAGFYVPWLLFGLPAGALVDRWPRRRVMVIADLLRASMLACLVAAMTLGWVSIPLLVVAVLCIGVAQCFFDSAAQACIPAAVGRDKDALAHVNGRFWALDTAGRSLLGPPIGSASFAFRQALPFVIDGASFLVSAALVRRLPVLPPGDGSRETLSAAIRRGLSHLFKTSNLLVLALSMGAYNFAFNASMAIFVLYAREMLALPSAAYGVLLAATAVGGVATGWRAQLLTRRLSYRQAMTIAHLTQAAAWLGIALTGNVWVTGALLAALGGGSTLSSVAVGSARQALTPDALLGRVVSAFRLFGLGAAGLGALIGGTVANFFGLTSALIFSAVILALGAVFTWPRRRQ